MKGIIIGSFGTTNLDGVAEIELVERAIERRLTGVKTLRAYTSRMVIARTKKRHGVSVPTEAEALERLREAGVERVGVQSLHLLPGHEYEKLMALGIPVGDPLFGNQRGIDAFVEAQPREERAVLWVGHGSDHKADELYVKLQEALREKGIDNVYIASIEGSKDYESVRAELEKDRVKQVVLKPLLLVAGVHAHEDIGGDGEASWSVKFKNEGFDVEVELKGLGQETWVQNVFADYAEELVKNL